MKAGIVIPVRRGSGPAVAVALFLFLGPAFAQDVVFLKTGESAVCRVETITDNILTFSLISSGGPAGGSAKRTISMDQVAYVEFDFASGEEEAFARRESLKAATLETWWNHHFANLHRPRSRTAAFGVAFGKALLRESPEDSALRALALFDRIIERAWSPEDVGQAKQGRLEALIATGDLETATVEAEKLAEETEDPALLIEVNYLLARADFEALRALEAEHPRWMEDDEVRPERERLYHEVVDRFLWPHLFHATREDAASRGLFSAGGIHEFAGEMEWARHAYEDLVRLYPGTSFAEKAAVRLESLSAESPADETATHQEPTEIEQP